MYPNRFATFPLWLSIAKDEARSGRSCRLNIWAAETSRIRFVWLSHTDIPCFEIASSPSASLCSSSSSSRPSALLASAIRKVWSALSFSPGGGNRVIVFILIDPLFRFTPAGSKPSCQREYGMTQVYPYEPEPPSQSTDPRLRSIDASRSRSRCEQWREETV